MNIKVLYICMGTMFVAMISLSIYIYVLKQTTTCERIHLDGKLKLWDSEDAVPDEITAKKIADIIISIQKQDYNAEEYNVEIDFNESEYIWELYYSLIPPDGGAILGGEISIKIRKDCGMVVDMYFT